MLNTPGTAIQAHPAGRAKLCVLVVCLAASFAATTPAQSQQTVFAWTDYGERLELQVLQLAVTPRTLSPGLANAYLDAAGFDEFVYGGLDYCGDAHLFTHPDASAAPILAAVQALGSEPASPFFWTFTTDLMGTIGTGGGGNRRYWIRIEPWVDLDSLLDSLAIDAATYGPGPDGWVELHPTTRSALEMLHQVDLLHDSPGVLEATIGLPIGCPSGGPGTGVPPPIAVPTASRLALALLALVVGAAAVARLRAGRSGR